MDVEKSMPDYSARVQELSFGAMTWPSYTGVAHVDNVSRD